jgi:hypothetical protein
VGVPVTGSGVGFVTASRSPLQALAVAVLFWSPE